MKDMDELPNDILDKISYHLDNYQKQQLSFTCKRFHNLLYDEEISNSCNNELISFKFVYNQSLRTIARIGKNGVLFGECEDCHSEGLLYESLNPNPSQHPTKWICLERCKFTCLTCESVIYSKTKNGWHDPIMCSNCYTRINTFIWE